MRVKSIPGPPLVTLACIVSGAALVWLPNGAQWRFRFWMAALVVCGFPVAYRTARGLLRGEFAADVVAMLAILGTVALGQPLAGLVVVLMQTGGEALDAYAVARASDAVKALEADAPRVAHRFVGTVVEDIVADQIEPEDLILVRPGELTPCDGVVVAGASHLDTARLTGEAIPVRAATGAPVMSGCLNQEGALTIRATRRSSESQYARIVDLVRTAQASKSPLQRTADRFAVWFTPLTLLACTSAWFAAHDWTRVLAVLVVATPCPLILAAPVAIIGGINRAARRAIIVRHGGALEALSKVTVAVFDKTGTLTVGRPRVISVSPDNGTDPNTALALAAAVEQGSGHLLARVTVAAAEEAGLNVRIADGLHEQPGQGVTGIVDGAIVAVGSVSFVKHAIPEAATRIVAMENGAAGLRAYVASSSGMVARIQYADEVRPDLAGLFTALRGLGITRSIMLSGDRRANVAKIAAVVGITEFDGDLQAEDKVIRVQALEKSGVRVLMVGDGTNDAPALSAASVGVALGGHGGGVVAEAADVVLLIDDPLRVAEAISIGRRSMQIARQSIAVGLGLSLVGMAYAATGHLAPITGALLQEAIDVAVILNALRASAK